MHTHSPFLAAKLVQTCLPIPERNCQPDSLVCMHALTVPDFPERCTSLSVTEFPPGINAAIVKQVFSNVFHYWHIPPVLLFI